MRLRDSFSSRGKRATIFVINSWDDVTSLDLKLCDCLETYNLKGTFFVGNNWIGKKISVDELRCISERHEIGAHTVNHVNLLHVCEGVARREISESKKLLEKVIENSIDSFAYPYGLYNKAHVLMVQNANYLCARTTKPFYVNKAENPYELNVTIWAFPHALRDLKGMFRLLRLSPKLIVNPLRIKRWNELGKRIFNILLESGGVFHLHGHAYQIKEKSNLLKLEDLLAHIAFRKDIIYATLSEYSRSCYYS